jgi:hypothetical protein
MQVHRNIANTPSKTNGIFHTIIIDERFINDHEHFFLQLLQLANATLYFKLEKLEMTK